MQLAVAAFLAAFAAPAEYVVTTDRVFVPPGMQSDEPAQLVVEGRVLQTCDMPLEPRYKVHAAERVIEVALRATNGEGPCVHVMRRMTYVLEVGPLAAGEWQVVTNGGWLVEPFYVTQAAAEPDAGAAALMDAAYIEPGAADGSGWNAVLRGRLLASCDVLRDVAVREGGRVVVLEPHVEAGDGPCQAEVRTFWTRVELPTLAPGARYLLSVRGAGTALNHVFPVPQL